MVGRADNEIEMVGRMINLVAMLVLIILADCWRRIGSSRFMCSDASKREKGKKNCSFVVAVVMVVL